jgi:hypothetical protein
MTLEPDVTGPYTDHDSKVVGFRCYEIACGRNCARPLELAEFLRLVADYIEQNFSGDLRWIVKTASLDIYAGWLTLYMRPNTPIEQEPQP